MEEAQCSEWKEIVDMTFRNICPSISDVRKFWNLRLNLRNSGSRKGMGSCSGLVVQPRFWHWAITNSRPDSTEDKPVHLYDEGYIKGLRESFIINRM
ncbi:hypothetical protein AVEN_182537-1 [Araneus ventricosus]|uniref:Uncharacterized protein n=1 Tax=Araneus ventricosus TaxID=182803 RepID=A0A4Y2BXJ5_ARAVE|nr:hypothetical protein AVEN_182537-1 [Araneus ventricosus]